MSTAMGDAEERLRRSWEQNAAAWSSAVRSQSIESRRAVTDAAVLDAVLAHEPRRVLDAGCGEGWLTRALAARNVEVTGFDGSAELVALAERAGGGTFLRLEYDEVADEPTRAGTDHDVVVCNFSLIGRDIDRVLRAFRAIAPRGRLVIQTLSPAAADADELDGWREESFASMPGAWSGMPWYFRTPASWRALLTDAGWTDIRCHTTLHPQTRRPASLILDAGAGDG
jgi:2-polyprenyl-3-methyl-5-hydroxy-6-metoxy-1,4-benzoquinol methylase